MVGRTRGARWLRTALLPAVLLLAPGAGSASADGAGEAAGAAGAEMEDLAGLVPFGGRSLAARARSAGGDLAARLKAVEGGLAWLAAHQHEDGLWHPEDLAWCDGKRQSPVPAALASGAGKPMYAEGVTGLALMAFLAAGEDHRDGGPHAEAIRRGLGALARVQDPEGCFGARTTQHFIYNHGLALLAFLESFAATGDARLVPRIQAGLDFSERARNPGLGWRYGVRPGDNDTSATVLLALGFAVAWHVNDAAVAAGRIEPFRLPPQRRGETDHPFPGTLAWLDRMTDPDSGRVGYVTRGSGPARPREEIDHFPLEQSEAMTAAALAARLLLPREVPPAANEGEVIRKGFALLAALPPRWAPGDGSIDLYYWYYGTLAWSLQGGDGAKSFDRAVVQALALGQRSDGTPCDVKGSWDAADPWRTDGGRIYSTAMAVLCLAAPGRLSRHAPDPKEIVATLERKGASPAALRRALETVALHRIREAGPAVAPLADAPDPGVRAAALQALGGIAPPAQAKAAVDRALTAESAAVREAAARVVAGLPRVDAGFLPRLAALLVLPDAGGRVAAARALARLGPEARAALPELTRLAAEADPLGRVAAAEALVAIDVASGPAALVLGEALRSSDAGVRRAAARVAAGHAGADAPLDAALASALDDADPRVATYAALASRRRRLPDERIARRLAAGLDARDPAFVSLVLGELASMGEAGRGGMEHVAALAHGGPRAVRLPATKTLLAIGGVDALAHLYAIREDALAEVRQAADQGIAGLALSPTAAAERLGSRLLVGPGTDEARGARAGLLALGAAAVPALRKVIETPGTPASGVATALRIAGDLGPGAAPLAPAALRVLVHESDPVVVPAAAYALGRMGVATPEVLEALRMRLGSTEGAVAFVAVDALGRLAAATPEAARYLTTLIADAAVPERMRLEAIRAAGHAGSQALHLLPTLLDLLAGPPDSGPREAAVRAVAALGEPGMKVLRDAVGAGTDPPLTGVLQALARMGPKAAPALPELQARLVLLVDPSAAVLDPVFVAVGAAAVKPLLKTLAKAPRGREARIARILGWIGPPAKDAVGVLEKLGRSADFETALAAQEALSRIRQR